MLPAREPRRRELLADREDLVLSWKGTARYLDVQVDGDRNPAAAWYYAEPKRAAEEIRDRVAFWRGVTVTE